MSAPRVVEAFDVIEGIGTGFISGAIFVSTLLHLITTVIWHERSHQREGLAAGYSCSDRTN